MWCGGDRMKKGALRRQSGFVLLSLGNDGVQQLTSFGYHAELEEFSNYHEAGVLFFQIQAAGY